MVLFNLGTPESPTPAALRRYLAGFLSDPRVVEIPRLLWRSVLHGIILRVHPKKSALDAHVYFQAARILPHASAWPETSADYDSQCVDDALAATRAYARAAGAES